MQKAVRSIKICTECIGINIAIANDCAINRKCNKEKNNCNSIICANCSAQSFDWNFSKMLFLLGNLLQNHFLEYFVQTEQVENGPVVF